MTVLKRPWVKKALILSFFVFCVFFPKLAEASVGTVDIMVNGKPIAADVNPYIADGRTMVPFRAIFEALQAEVGFSSSPVLKVWGIKDSVRIDLTKGSHISLVNGVETDMGCRMEIKEGRTFVPLRFVASSMGCEITWEPRERVVYVITGGQARASVTVNTDVVISQEKKSVLSLVYPMADPGEWLKFAVSSQKALDPVFAGRLAAFARDHGKKITISSGYRNYNKQVALYVKSGGYQDSNGNWIGGSGMAARPGSSWHEFGEAADVSDSWVKALNNVKVDDQREFLKYGLCKPLAPGNGTAISENWHIQPIETRYVWNPEDKHLFFDTFNN